MKKRLKTIRKSHSEWSSMLGAPGGGAVPQQHGQYLDVANVAAKLERRGEYGQAAEQWLSAGLFAQSSVSRHWCEVRQTLCLRAERLAYAQPITSRSECQGEARLSCDNPSGA